MSGQKSVFLIGVLVLLGAGQVLGDIISFDPFPIGSGFYTNNVDFQYQGPTDSPIVGYIGTWTAGAGVAKSSTTTVDAPNLKESGGTFRVVIPGDEYTKRRIYRSFTELPCDHWDTNYWSAVIYLDGLDPDGDAYVTWRDTDKAEFMALDLGIINGHLAAGLRATSGGPTLNLGPYTPGKAYHMVVRGIVSGAEDVGNSFEDTTIWINPTRDDLINETNIAATYRNISFISPTYDHDEVSIVTESIAGHTAYFDELLYTTDFNDINFSLPKIVSATYDPMPRPDDSGAHIHAITHDFDLMSISLGNGRYTDLEGPTNAWVTAEYEDEPANGEEVTADEAFTGLHVSFAGNVSTAEVAFATTVTNGFPGGFFLLEVNGDDHNIVVLPLDADRNPIGNWSLTLTGSGVGGTSTSAWSDNLTGEGELALMVGFTDHISHLNGLAFSLGDFTGDSGVLDNVKGLKFIDSSPSFDPIMTGIYKGPAEEPLAIGSGAVAMTGANFNRAFPDNPITNDFSITGIATAEREWRNIEGTSKANIHVLDSSIIVYPQNGTAPADREAALEGLDFNGVLATGCYVEFMFSSPVKDLNERIFIMEDITFDKDPIKVLPLDADRFPISTYSLQIGSGDWGGSLTPYSITYQPWGGTHTGRSFGGTVFSLSDFAGGTGPIESVWGIRIEDPYGEIDAMIVGRTRETGTLVLIQ